MSTPDTTADAIRGLTDELAKCGARAVRLRDDRDALQQRVERLRAAWRVLAWAAAESTRGRFTDADEAAAKHLMPGDLGDEKEDG